MYVQYNAPVISIYVRKRPENCLCPLLPTHYNYTHTFTITKINKITQHNNLPSSALIQLFFLNSVTCLPKLLHLH